MPMHVVVQFSPKPYVGVEIGMRRLALHYSKTCVIQHLTTCTIS